MLVHVLKSERDNESTTSALQTKNITMRHRILNSFDKLNKTFFPKQQILII